MNVSILFVQPVFRFIVHGLEETKVDGAALKRNQMRATSATTFYSGISANRVFYLQIRSRICLILKRFVLFSRRSISETSGRKISRAKIDSIRLNYLYYTPSMVKILEGIDIHEDEERKTPFPFFPDGRETLPSREHAKNESR